MAYEYQLLSDIAQRDQVNRLAGYVVWLHDRQTHDLHLQQSRDEEGRRLVAVWPTAGATHKFIREKVENGCSRYGVTQELGYLIDLCRHELATSGRLPEFQ